jgi:uncharacterized protein (DUF2267 family)
MSDAGFAAFSKTVGKTNEVLEEIEQGFGWGKERRHQSYAALRAVLHALRDRLTVEEAAQLGAQLPILVRGVYYGDWDPSRVPMRQSREDFLDRIRSQFPYDVEGGTEQVARIVLRAVSRYVSEGEWRGIAAGLPRDLVSLVPAQA